jgi:hypothetical protein
MNPHIFKALYDEAGYKQAAKSFFYWIPEDCEGGVGLGISRTIEEHF